MQSTSTTLFLGGATVVAACFLGGIGARALQRFSTMAKLPRGIRNAPKGGFEPRMSRYEAAQVVGMSERFITRAKLAERYKKTMLANHPDRGGSPYLALKINEAKRVLAPFAK